MNLGLVLGLDSGLLPVLAAAGGTADDIAARAGTDPRMTLEWLRVMVLAGFADHADETFRPVDGLAELVGDGGPLTPAAAMVGMVDRDPRLRPRLAEAIRTGSGLPQSVYEPEGSLAQDVLTAAATRRDLLPHILGAVPGLLDRLRAGIDVLEIGCGGGEALVVMAQAHPASRYTGYDVAPDALARARAKADAARVTVRVQQRDVAEIPTDAFDLVLAIDTVHDLGDPLTALEAARAGLREGGLFVMCEAAATGDFETDRHSSVAWQYYTSLTSCIPLSQGAGGPGLGSLWGRSAALPLLEQAGFAVVTVHDTTVERDVYACRAEHGPARGRVGP